MRPGFRLDGPGCVQVRQFKAFGKLLQLRFPFGFRQALDFRVHVGRQDNMTVAAAAVFDERLFKYDRNVPRQGLHDGRLDVVGKAVQDVFRQGAGVFGRDVDRLFGRRLFFGQGNVIFQLREGILP